MEYQGNRNLERLALDERINAPSRRNLALDASAGEFSKIPPQARDFERLVLGAILLDDTAINSVVVKLKPHHFYVDAHFRIYEAMYSLFLADAPIDPATVTEELKKAGNLEAVGGSYFLVQLTSEVGSSAHVEYHAQIIIQKWTQRAIIAAGSNTIKDAYEDSCDPLVLMAEASERFLEIQQSITTTGKKVHSDEVGKLYEEMLVRKGMPEDEKKVLGLKTGIWKLDQRIYGLCKGNLIILAGNPSEGKSTAMIQTLVTNADEGRAVGCFSLEMTYTELLQKMIALKSGVDLEKIMQSNMDDTEWSRVNKAFDTIMKYKMYIDDTPDQDVLDIVAMSKIWKLKHDIELLTVDYLQLSRAPENNRRIQTREQEISFISGKLKGLAKDLDIPVLALSQLSRANEKRADKRPILSDLRDGGSIEQDANVVIFFFRPEKHGIDRYPSQFSTKNITEISVSKCRMGKLGTVYAKFLGATGMFDNSHAEIKNSVEDGEEAKPTANASNIFKKKDEDSDLPF